MNAELQIPLFDLEYGPEESQAVQRVLDSKWLTMGEETIAFEKEFAAYIGVKHAFAVANCTAALHLANLACDVGPGDEVICPSLSFVATSNSILYTGAKPVFADICSLDEWTISPEDIESKVSERTKAIIVMHYAGYPCRMSQINAIARRHNLKVIEDCAHAPGASLDGKMAGALGDVSCFSFFSNKNMSTGEGGMICTDNDSIAERLRLLRSHGMTSLTLDRHKGHSFSYDVVALGYNYRIDEIHSALGRAQLCRLAQGNRRRKEVTLHYSVILREIDGVTLPFQSSTASASYHIFPVLLREGIDRLKVMTHLRSQGIQTSIHYPLIHTFSLYSAGGAASALPFSEVVGRSELTLPLFPSLTLEQIECVALGLSDAVRQAGNGAIA